jgi:hypothetical protein
MDDLQRHSDAMQARQVRSERPLGVGGPNSIGVVYTRQDLQRQMSSQLQDKQRSIFGYRGV